MANPDQLARLLDGSQLDPLSGNAVLNGVPVELARAGGCAGVDGRQAATAPQLDGFVSRLDGEGALEVEVKKGQDLNGVFAQLDRQGIRVLSMRTKTNRLEELFMGLVEGKQATGAEQAATRSTTP